MGFQACNVFSQGIELNHMRIKPIALICLAAAVPAAPAFASKIQIITIQQNALPLDAVEHFVSSAPADGETLKEFPQQVIIRFTRQVKADRLVVKVTDPFGTQVSGQPVVDGLAVMTPLNASTVKGKYRVRWRAECACDDNTQMSDSFNFTVQ